MKPSDGRQPRTFNTRRKIIDQTYKERNKAKDKEINDFKEKS
jgi:hypothetical protein